MRENLADKLCEVYHDDKILETYKIYDDKEISIQLIQNPDQRVENCFLVMVKLWDTDSWTLG